MLIFFFNVHCTFQREKVDRLEQQAAALQTKIMELNKSPFSKITKNEKLEEW